MNTLIVLEAQSYCKRTSIVFVAAILSECASMTGDSRASFSVCGAGGISPYE